MHLCLEHPQPSFINSSECGTHWHVHRAVTYSRRLRLLSEALVWFILRPCRHDNGYMDGANTTILTEVDVPLLQWTCHWARLGRRSKHVLALLHWLPGEYISSTIQTRCHNVWIADSAKTELSEQIRGFLPITPSSVPRIAISGRTCVSWKSVF